MQIERILLAIKIDQQTHMIAVRSDYTAGELYRYVLNAFDGVLKYILDYEIAMLYKGQNLMLAPNTQLRHVLPVAVRSTIEMCPMPQEIYVNEHP